MAPTQDSTSEVRQIPPFWLSDEGKDAAGLDTKARARLRGEALAWLTAELAQRTRQLHGGKASDRAEVQEKMRDWQQDEDLAGVRDAAALARLPAAERRDWQKVWADVAALLARAGGSP
jgi:hypothetical protein